MAKKAEKKPDDTAFVTCEEVSGYLTELSTVLEQISTGIKGSIEVMEEKAKSSKEKGEQNDGKQD